MKTLKRYVNHRLCKLSEVKAKEVFITKSDDDINEKLIKDNCEKAKTENGCRMNMTMTCDECKTAIRYAGVREMPYTRVGSLNAKIAFEVFNSLNIREFIYIPNSDIKNCALSRSFIAFDSIGWNIVSFDSDEIMVNVIGIVE